MQKNYDDLNTDSTINPSLYTKDKTTRLIQNLRKLQLLFTVAAVIILALAVSIFVVLTGKKTDTASQKEAVPTPQYIFYLKGNSLYSSSLNDIKPQKITDKFYHDLRTITVPIFMSDNGKWLFYPQGSGESADLYASPLGAGQTSQVMIAKNADIFTTNPDASKLIYMSDHKLYWSTNFKAKMIAEHVDRYFTNKACDRIVYVSSDAALYYIDTNMESSKLADKVSMKYVSQDLDTIYYTTLGALHQIKNCKKITKIYDGDSPRLYIYENGDFYYQNGSALYYYSNGKSTMVSNDCSFLYYCNEGGELYPYGSVFCGTAEPVIVYTDSGKNFFLCRGAQVLKKISGGYLADAEVDSKRNTIYYTATNGENDREGDLFHVTINGKKVSKSTKIATGVAVFSCFYSGNHLTYMKNTNDYTADLYIDGKMIDHGVYTNFNRLNVTRIPNNFFYPVNTKNYYSKITNTHYTDDTIMLYSNGVSKKVADHVIDYMVFNNKFVYLTIDDLDADYGTLHLFKPDGDDKIIDTNVTGLIRTTTDRDRGGEIDQKYAIYPTECG